MVGDVHFCHGDLQSLRKHDTRMYENATRMYEIPSFMYAEIHGFVFVFANVKKTRQ